MALTCLLVQHVFGDFYCQTREVATKKSSEPRYLILHGAIISISLTLFAGIHSFLYGNWWCAITFVAANVLLHCAQDWHIWRFYKSRRDPLTPYYDDENFYLTIGIDQMLHVTVLIWTYILLLA